MSQHLIWAVALAGSLLLGGAAPVLAQPKAQGSDGIFVTVSTPITETGVNLIEHKIKDAAKKRHIKTVVFDFNPGGERAMTSDPFICLRLQEYIEELTLGRAEGVAGPLQSVAFVHGDAGKHTLLPVLACNQLILSQGATLGPIAGGQETLPEAIRTTYAELAKAKQATDFVDRMLKGQIISAEEARQNKQFCQEIYNTRERVAEALDLPRQSLKENWLAGRVPVAALISLQGTVNADKLSSLERRLKAAVLEGKNLIFLELDCEGGDLYSAIQFQDQLKNRKDRDGYPLTLVAWVPPNRSLGAATYLALCCTEIVMGENSALGDFSALSGMDPEDLRIKAEVLAKKAEERHYPALLFQATLDPGVVAYHVQSKKTGERYLVTPETYEKEKHLWNFVAELPRGKNSLAKIDAQTARDWDVAMHTGVNSADELFARYDLEPSQVKHYRDDWLDRVAEFFRQPLVKLFILLIGITGLILEVKMPGFGIPGIVAAICFVLFFWSHSFVNQYTMLAVLLFVLGVVLLAVELFILPGFGVTGISGLLLLIVSVVLVMVEKRPETPQDWEQIGWALGTFCVSALGAIGLAIAIVSVLPQVPYANRLMLRPPESGEDEAASAEPLAGLLGAIGIAETPLRPAGKVRFGDEYLDVVSEGDYVMPGNRVQVIEIEGNRIVVKQVF